jgi:hypothetical protein
MQAQNVVVIWSRLFPDKMKEQFYVWKNVPVFYLKLMGSIFVYEFRNPRVQKNLLLILVFVLLQQFRAIDFLKHSTIIFSFKDFKALDSHFWC